MWPQRLRGVLPRRRRRMIRGQGARLLAQSARPADQVTVTPDQGTLATYRQGSAILQAAPVLADVCQRGLRLLSQTEPNQKLRALGRPPNPRPILVSTPRIPGRRSGTGAKVHRDDNPAPSHLVSAEKSSRWNVRGQRTGPRSRGQSWTEYTDPKGLPIVRGFHGLPRPGRWKRAQLWASTQTHEGTTP